MTALSTNFDLDINFKIVEIRLMVECAKRKIKLFDYKKLGQRELLEK
ncbi:hypothetical protein C8C77_12523 [Halanaerobium saccharolyticum]|uniref:Uncharacterized protein n=1 Tax=Halanaerobium saccharolyticum TaxID=43595 RepID=A0A4R7YX88_9FIRM|nr:hypothetical protein [Halanaerobium saccharolyticum]RAK06304.1 hypothetical protein C7958_12421 [Halanaerobium saccharolyticum]TDW00783.1 hypothetical protein C8C77_12523 [Halanaerobium saccharolyticum]TDX52425.1 hypothetical protein C7956_12423 [Halanaerobium saccharolyticum]